MLLLAVARRQVPDLDSSLLCGMTNGAPSGRARSIQGATSTGGNVSSKFGTIGGGQLSTPKNHQRLSVGAIRENRESNGAALPQWPAHRSFDNRLLDVGDHVTVRSQRSQSSGGLQPGVPLERCAGKNRPRTLTRNSLEQDMETPASLCG